MDQRKGIWRVCVWPCHRGTKGDICESFLSHVGKGEFLQHAVFWNTEDGGFFSPHCFPGSQAQVKSNIVITQLHTVGLGLESRTLDCQTTDVTPFLHPLPSFLADQSDIFLSIFLLLKPAVKNKEARDSLTLPRDVSV